MERACCFGIVGSLHKLLPWVGKPQVRSGCCSRFLQLSQPRGVLSASKMHFPQTVSFGSQCVGNACDYDNLLSDSAVLLLGTRHLCLLFFLAAHSKKRTEKKSVVFLSQLELFFCLIKAFVWRTMVCFGTSPGKARP